MKKNSIRKVSLKKRPPKKTGARKAQGKARKKSVKSPVRPGVKVRKKMVRNLKNRVKVRKKRVKLRKKIVKFPVKPAAKVHKKRRIKKRSRGVSRGHIGHIRAPKGLCKSTKEWLASTYGQEGLTQRYNEFFTNDVTILHDSKGIDDRVHKHFRSGEVKAKPVFVAVLEDARVWEKNGAVITPDNRLLGDVSWDYNGGMVFGKHHTVFRKWHQPPLKHFRGTAGLLTFIWSGNYFHWLFDVLPRVHLLRLSGVPIDKYIVPLDKQAIQDETLNMLGIPKKRRIETDHNFHAKIDRLVVPSFVKSVNDHPSEYPLWITEFLRNEFLFGRDVPVSDKYERIYISRAKAWQRRLLNEEQVLQIIRSRGFQIIELEGRPFMEQVQIFASAKIVIAPHGAGLSNLVFSNPGTKVVEMFAPTYVSNYFWHLCNQLQLEHYYLLGEKSVKPHKDWWQGSVDFDVDLGKLERLLQIAGI